MKRGIFLSCFVVLLILLFSSVNASIGITGDAVSNSDLEVSSILLKVLVTQGDSVKKTIKVFSDEGGDHFLKVLGVEGVDVDEEIFTLDKGEEKEISINFDSSQLNPGVYIGQIEINNYDEIVLLPIVFEVESEDIFFDINLDIPSQYTATSPGGKISAKMTIFDLTGFQGVGSLGTTRIDVNYILSSLDGTVLSFEEEGIVVDGQSQFTKTFFLPKEVEKGKYVLSVIVKYKSSVGTSSQLINVNGLEKNNLKFFSGSDSNFLIFLVFLIILFLGIIFAFVYLIKSRDKFERDLRKYNLQELSRQKRFLFAQRKIIKGKKNISHKRIRKEIGRKIKKLKLKQAQRIKELKKLKKENRPNMMRKKLKEWKRKGYTNSVLEYKLKDLSSKEMKNLINEWKRLGYKI